MSDALPPAPVVRDFLCPMCQGDGDDRHCVCDGGGLVDAAIAAFWSDVTPARQLPPPPAAMDAPCVDCAFRGDSPEHEDAAARAMLLRKVAEGRPFYCHQGMHCTEGGTYVPFASVGGEPVGHPVCAGWSRARERLLRLARGPAGAPEAGATTEATPATPEPPAGPAAGQLKSKA